MAAKFLPKQSPTDVWSLREKLALACTVKRTGDNNWVSVNRAIKPYGEVNRPTDWFSQKNCALQYSDLLEKVETPKRKRGERDLREAPGDVISRKLTIERIEELKRIVQEEQQIYKKLKNDIEKCRSGHSDDCLQEILDEMEKEKQEAEEKDKKWAEAMVTREAKLNKKLIHGVKVKVELEDSIQDSPADTMSLIEDDSNQSNPSASTPLSSTSQDIKPTLSTTVLTLDQSLEQTLQPKKEIIEDTPPTVSQNDEADTAVKDDHVTPKKEELIPAADIKTEPIEIDVESTNSIEDEAVLEPPRERKSTSELLEDSDATEDNTSAVGTEETPGDCSQNRQDSHDGDLFVRVVEEKEDKYLENVDSASEGPHKDDDQPLSPASSILSNDTDAGSMIQGKGRRSRGGKQRNGRRSNRVTKKSILPDDKTKESETSSKAESSDEDGCDTTIPESDDTASNATGRMQMSFSESVPNSPASIAPGDTEDEKAHKIWKKSILLVWRSASNHKYANVFSHPVTEEIAPGYHSVVSRPLDLTAIKKNIENLQIRTTADFQRDMMLMFTNAIMYNNSDHDVFKMATDMYDDVMRHIEIIVQGGEPKLLRTSRRSEAHSDKEDDPKRKRSGTEQQDGGKAKKRKARD